MKRPVDIISKSKHSLVHMGSLDSFDLTPGGIDAARNIMKYFETGDKSCLEESVRAYDKIIPSENFGGEYTALRWICRLLLAPSDKLAKDFLEEPTVESWYNYLKENDFEKLKTYIKFKYHFEDLSPKDTENSRMLRFLEDFILFSNPDRERWEKTRSMLRKLRIEEGLTIADVGCGSGYFTFKFADMVGSSGKIYGIEINPLHLDYLRKFKSRHNIKNVEIVESNSNGIGLEQGVKADIVFSCSLFHVLYSVFKEEDRRSFIESIKNTLNPGGALIVIDNDLVEDGTLPYHGPYIAKDLLVSQLYYYGFKLVKTVQVTKQRYALIFENQESDISGQEDKTDLKKGIISAMSGASLVKYNLASAVPESRYTKDGRNAAELFLRALTEKNHEIIDAAKNAYEKIIPSEQIGGEYTAFSWLCDCMKADGQTLSQMLEDLLAKEYYDYLSENDFALLKKYLYNRYELDGKEDNFIDSGDVMQLSEYIAFNNPARERWEKTSKMIELLNIKPGEVIADVGCGSGYFTYKFANLTGSSGKVYATEINKDALSYVEDMRERHNLNIIPVVSALNDAKLPENQFDKIFMCSMYHAVYIASIEFVKDGFIGSIKKALKSGGKLIVVDNEVTRDGAPDYHGSGIDRRLVKSQLGHYGFKLLEEKQFVPQRYILIFQKDK